MVDGYKTSRDFVARTINSTRKLDGPRWAHWCLVFLALPGAVEVDAYPCISQFPTATFVFPYDYEAYPTTGRLIPTFWEQQGIQDSPWNDVIAFLGGQRGLWTPVIEGLNLINIHSFSTCWNPKIQWQAEILDHFGGRSFLVSTLRMPLSALALWQQPGETNWEMSKSCEKKSVLMKQKLMFPISYFLFFSSFLAELFYLLEGELYTNMCMQCVSSEVGEP